MLEESVFQPAAPLAVKDCEIIMIHWKEPPNPSKPKQHHTHPINDDVWTINPQEAPAGAPSTVHHVQLQWWAAAAAKVLRELVIVIACAARGGHIGANKHAGTACSAMATTRARRAIHCAPSTGPNTRWTTQLTACVGLEQATQSKLQLG